MLRGLRNFKQDYPIAKLYILYLGNNTLYLPDEIVALPFVIGLQKLPEILQGGQLRGLMQISDDFDVPLPEDILKQFNSDKK